MMDDDTGASEKAPNSTIEQALPVLGSILAPALGVVVEVLDKIADDLTPQK